MADEEGSEQHFPTIQDIVDALLLFDEPILNHRFHSLLMRHQAPEVRKDLQVLPEQVLKAERSARTGGMRWEQQGGLGVHDELFRARSERALIESFLSLTESEIRLFSFLARNAPDQERREPFDAAAQRLRSVATVLRHAASRSMQNAGFPDEQPDPAVGRSENVQVLDQPEGLRERVTQAIHHSRDANREPRLLVLSHTAFRHLRDEGCFRDREGALNKVPASIDFGWDGLAFALLTYETATLEEIFDSATQRGTPRPSDRSDEA